MWITRVLFAFPLVIGGVFLVAFFVARENFHKRVNYFIIGSIGDAERLNPVLATDAASGDVNDLVFNGLVKYDENLELTGDVAASWEIRQRSSVYPRADFPGGPAALAELISRNLAAEAREEYAVTDVRAKDRRVVIEMGRAGTAFQQSVLSVVPEKDLRTLGWIEVQLDTTRRLSSGEGAESKNLAKVLQTFTAKRAGRAWEVLDVRTPLPERVEIDVLGEPGPLVAFLKEQLPVVVKREGGETQEEPAGTVTVRTGLFDNNPIVTFHLRDDVRFHDGVPLTSADVAFTYDVLMDEKTQTVRRSDFEPVKELETPDPLTVRVTYKRPFVPCLEAWSMGILPRHILEAEDINETSFNRAPVGTGPFRFERWPENNPRSQCRLLRGMSLPRRRHLQDHSRPGHPRTGIPGRRHRHVQHSAPPVRTLC